IGSSWHGPMRAISRRSVSERRMHVLSRTCSAALSIIAMLALATGCAALRETSSAPNPVALNEIKDLSGTWSGTLGWVGASLYEGEGTVTLQIKEDGTFTGKVTPNRGTNNLTKASTLAGTVVANGSRVTLRSTEGPWTWLTFVRSGDTMYVANDPSMQANVMLKVDREGGRGPATAHSNRETAPAR